MTDPIRRLPSFLRLVAFCCVALIVVGASTGCGKKRKPVSGYQSVAVSPVVGDAAAPGYSDSFRRPHELRKPPPPEDAEEEDAPRQRATGPRRIALAPLPTQLTELGIEEGVEITAARAALDTHLETVAIANDGGYMVTKEIPGTTAWYLVFRNGRLVEWRPFRP